MSRMTRLNRGAPTSLRPVLIGIGSFTATILLILSSNAQGRAILA